MSPALVNTHYSPERWGQQALKTFQAPALGPPSSWAGRAGYDSFQRKLPKTFIRGPSQSDAAKSGARAHCPQRSQLWALSAFCKHFSLVNGNFVPRITKNEIKAIPLLIKVQLGTVAFLRCMHQHKRHKKGLKKRAHKSRGTWQQPWHKHMKKHNTVR